jgi:hypothetical protein
MNHDPVTHNAQSDDPATAQHAYVVLPDKPEHAYVPDEPIAESTKLKRTTMYLEPVSLAFLGAIDGQSAAWHVRRAVAAYVDRMIKPTAADAPAVDPLSVSLTPGAHTLAADIAQRMGVGVGQLVSAAVLEQLEAMR